MKSHTYPPTRHFPEVFWGYSSIWKGKRPSLDPACLCSRWGTAETPGNEQLCSSYSRNAFQETLWLLGPPLVLYATSQPDVQSALLSPWSLKLCVKLWEKTRFLLQGLFSSAKDLRDDLNFIFLWVLFKIYLKKKCTGWLYGYKRMFSSPVDKVLYFYKCFIKKPTNSTPDIP